jgi:hypothetical protein
MSIVIQSLPKIKSIEFLNSSVLFVHLDNDRTFLVPLEQFPAIKNLTSEERKDYEIIDDIHLSFLSIDEVYSLNDLIGIE